MTILNPNPFELPSLQWAFPIDTKRKGHFSPWINVGGTFIKTKEQMVTDLGQVSFLAPSCMCIAHFSRSFYHTWQDPSLWDSLWTGRGQGAGTQVEAEVSIHPWVLPLALTPTDLPFLSASYLKWAPSYRSHQSHSPRTISRLVQSLFSWEAECFQPTIPNTET